MSGAAAPQDGQTTYDYRTLRKVGEACYGAGIGLDRKFSWVGKIATDFRVNVRVVERWASGDYEIPPNIWRELVDICRERAVDLKTIATRLEKGERLD